MSDATEQEHIIARGGPNAGTSPTTSIGTTTTSTTHISLPSSSSLPASALKTRLTPIQSSSNSSFGAKLTSSSAPVDSAQNAAAPPQPAPSRSSGRSSQYKVIGFEHMDMNKFALLSVANSVLIRTTIYPTMLIKTRLQCEKSGSSYSSGRDAFRKILSSEGLRGLYRGYSFYIASAFVGSCYILTYEHCRHWMAVGVFSAGPTVQNLAAGAAASIVGQTMMVPIDVVSQHMMMLARRDKQFHWIGRVEVAKSSSVSTVARTVYSEYGLLGVYKGYFSSIATYASNSALWWHFYHLYNDLLCNRVPDWVPSVLCTCVTGPMAGLTSAYLTNPLDVIRARMQVEGQPTALATLRNLVHTEGFLQGVHKGVATRMFNASVSSLIITLLYELTKRVCLKPHYVDEFKW